MSKNGTAAGSSSGAGRGNLRSSAAAHRATKGTPEARAKAIMAKVDARVRHAEVAKRKDLHDGKGGLNRETTPAQKASIARHNRTLNRAQAAHHRLRDASASLRKKAKS
jgi:hypothetical protein